MDYGDVHHYADTNYNEMAEVESYSRELHVTVKYSKLTPFGSNQTYFIHHKT